MTAHALHHAPRLRLTTEPEGHAHDDDAPKDHLAHGWLPVAAAAEALGLMEDSLRKRVKRARGSESGDPKLRRYSADIAAPAKDGAIRDLLHIHTSYDPARLLPMQRQLLSERDGSPATAETTDTTALATELESLPPAKRSDAAQRVELVLRWRVAKAGLTTKQLPAWLDRQCRDLGITPTIGKTRLYDMDHQARRACSGLPEHCCAMAMTLALVDRRGGPRRSACSPEAWSFFRGLYLDSRQWTVAKCHRTVKAEASKQGWSWPTLRRVNEMVREQITHAESVLARQGALSYDRIIKAPMEQHADAWSTGQRWEGDHARLDFFARVRRGGEWRAVRLWLSMWVDWRTHRIMGWAIDESADTRLIKLALKRGLEDESVSVPEILWIDNGKDYASRDLTGATKSERNAARSSSSGGMGFQPVPSSSSSSGGMGFQPVPLPREANQSQWAGLFRMLGMEPHFAIPYNPNGKAIVEGIFNFVHQDFDREFTSWCGSDPTQLPKDRKAEIQRDIEAMPTLDQVRTKFAEWVAFFNARSEHNIRGLMLPDADGEPVRCSPDAFYNATIGTRRRLAEPKVLDILDDHWSRPRRVHDYGVSFTPSAKVGALRYGASHPELAPYQGSDARRVIVRWNPDDLSRVALHDADTMRLVCWAERNIQHNAPGSAGEVRSEDYAAARERRKAARRAATQRLDLTALTADAHELAAMEARKRMVAETNAKLEEAGIDTKGAGANMRLVKTEFDDTEPDRESERMRKVVGSEWKMPDADEEDRDIFDRLAEVRDRGHRPPAPFLDDDNDDDDEIDLSALATGANGKRAGGMGGADGIRGSSASGIALDQSGACASDDDDIDITGLCHADAFGGDDDDDDIDIFGGTGGPA